ncbi:MULTISPECIES: hypothetical protein [unclassified Oceanicaulis]|uniref:hypothetical protein n=1 Tax=unclassified Oceanicaulis TaxID=2632123 RepID=UPI0025ECD29B|nr:MULTISPECIES: hypothetical protein [unclassified Oceanicaulis]
MDSAKLREILVEVAQGGAKVLADPEVFECAVNSGHEDIMSALKRGAGVVVKELSWRIDPDLGAEFGFMPGFDEFCYNITPYTKDGAQVWSAWLDDPDEGDLPDQGPFTSPEAAKAACQADFAKRITSAVEPSCVVTGLLPMDEAPQKTEGVLIFREDGAIASCWRGPGIAWRYSGEAWDCFVSDHEGRRAVGWLPLTAALSSRTEKEVFQDRVRPWVLSCFGEDIAADKLERNDRFIEEALELTQACGYDRDRAHALVDYVFDREPGEPSQEVGGVMVTLAAHCLAHGMNMHADGERELARISAPEIMAKIRAKQAAKPKGSALPVARSLTNGGE